MREENRTNMKNKFKLVVFPFIYLVLIFNVCLSFLLVFRSYYFRSIFVFGSSMEPTLNGAHDRVDYGIIDDHASAINNLKRFQILTTYYPFSSNDYVGGYHHGEKNVINENDASYKIKRVYGLPGEIIRFEVDNEQYEKIKDVSKSEMFTDPVQEIAQKCIKVFSKKTGDLNFTEQKVSFKRKINVNKIPNYSDFEYELGDDEYWVMGDNYDSSLDCFNTIPKQPVYRDNLVGVLIAIEGTCKIDSKGESGEGTKKSYKCTERKRHFPVFY